MNRRILSQEDNRGCRCSGLPIPQAARYAGMVALALRYLHGRGFVFRDMKPENILIDGEDRIKLADFGLAQLRADEQAMPGGTRGFMPSEMLNNPSCVAEYTDDLFAFGITLGMMLLGERVCDKLE